jgi:dolichol-phosphate mannosyltransferase
VPDRPVELTFLLLTRNERENLPDLVPVIRQAADGLGVTAEIVVVDASSDGTADVARSLGCKVMVQTAPGYGEAFRLGLATARGDFVLTMDADHSHPPDFIRDMWALRDAADVIIGSRYVPGGRAEMSIARRALSRTLNWVYARVLDLPLSDLSSGYRLYRRAIIDTLAPLSGRDFDILEEILVKAWCHGYRVREVPIEYRPRHLGRSNANAFKFSFSYLRTLRRLRRLRSSATLPNRSA